MANEIKEEHPDTKHPEFEKSEQEIINHIDKILSINGSKTVDHFHRELGKIMWQECAMSRTKEDLEKKIVQIKQLKQEFYTDVKVTGSNNEMNTELENAYRLTDFIELGILMCTDALQCRHFSRRGSEWQDW